MVSRLPKAVDLIGGMHGAVCVGTLADGTIGGKRVRRYMYQITSHDEAFGAMGVQGTGYQTGIPAACAALLLARGIVTRPGVLAPEQIDPAPFLDLMTEHGTPWGGHGPASRTVASSWSLPTRSVADAAPSPRAMRSADRCSPSAFENAAVKTS